MSNPNCDGAWCKRDDGEVRVLPYGGDGNLILCFSCYAHEMQFRRERNQKLAPDCQFETPEWKDLKVYDIDNS